MQDLTHASPKHSIDDKRLQHDIHFILTTHNYKEREGAEFREHTNLMRPTQQCVPTNTNVKTTHKYAKCSHTTKQKDRHKQKQQDNYQTIQSKCSFPNTQRNPKTPPKTRTTTSVKTQPRTRKMKSLSALSAPASCAALSASAFARAYEGTLLDPPVIGQVKKCKTHFTPPNTHSIRIDVTEGSHQNAYSSPF